MIQALFNLGVTHFHASTFYSYTVHCHVFLSVCFVSENFQEAIKAWKQSIELDPSNPDAHISEIVDLPTPSSASDLVLFPFRRSRQRLHHVPRPTASSGLGSSTVRTVPFPYMQNQADIYGIPTSYLRAASRISPDDPEIAFNLGAVLEACASSLPSFPFPLHQSIRS